MQTSFFETMNDPDMRARTIISLLTKFVWMTMNFLNFFWVAENTKQEVVWFEKERGVREEAVHFASAWDSVWSEFLQLPETEAGPRWNSWSIGPFSRLFPHFIPSFLFFSIHVHFDVLWVLFVQVESLRRYRSWAMPGFIFQKHNKVPAFSFVVEWYKHSHKHGKIFIEFLDNQPLFVRIFHPHAVRQCAHNFFFLRRLK